MQESKRLIDDLQTYAQFLSTLRSAKADVWQRPIDKGKWSIPDIVAHIMMWDKNCVEKVVRALADGRHGELVEDADPQGFNERAAAYGRTLSKGELLNEAIYWRTQLVSRLRELPASTFDSKPQGTNTMTLSTFLQQEFVSHDQHHTKEIENFIARS